jgi:hypothetical protein
MISSELSGSKSSPFETPASRAPQEEDFYWRRIHPLLVLRSDAKLRVSKDAIEGSDPIKSGP